jgi:acyl-[acyl-carrier-protein]-phospholipid O-acyltransferase/long-chain-fatty-acid--[acyl-carrier-protein] ligase
MHSIPLLFVALALFGVVAALFGPVKYAILPDQLQVSELATGNALVEGATFMAILIGTIAGGLFVAGASHMGWICLAVVGLSILSWAFAARIPVSQPSAPDLPITANPWTSTVHLLKSLYAEPRLWDGMVIVSWFWMVGAIVLSLLPALVKGGVGGTEGVVTVCLAVFAIGIAAGSLLAAQLSHVRPNLALVPIGAIVMGIVGLDLAWAIGSTVRGTDVTAAAFATSFAGFRMLADFFLFAVGGGLFVVPSFAAVQAWSAPSERARVIAAGNVLQAAFMVAGSLLVAGLQAAGLPVAWIFFGLAVASFGSVWFVLNKWGREGVRDFGALLFRALFRVEVRGMENLPARRHPHADRAEPCQPDRRPAAACHAADRRQLCRRHRDFQGVVGKTVLKTDQALHHGSEQAAGGARPDQAGGVRRAGGDFSRGPHHGVGLVDEGL